jgi:hypothetical protein
MIIVRYDGGGSGGEFLKNCLSLSNSAVMSHHVLAESQLDGKLNYDKKVKILNFKISNNSGVVWDDMGLYRGNFIGYNFGESKVFHSRTCFKLEFHPIMYRLTNKQEKYWIIKIHEYELVDCMLQVFPNAKIIDFMNEKLFRSIRNCNNSTSFFSFLFYTIITDSKICPKIYEKWKNLQTVPYLDRRKLISMVYEDFIKLIKDKILIESLKKKYHEQLIETIWNNVGNNKWPTYPKYIREYAKFDFELKQKIQNTLNNEYIKFKDNCGDLYGAKEKFMNNHLDKIIYTWNTDWYFSLEDTLKGFKELYEILGLDNYDETSLSLLYNSWIDKMDEIRKNQLLVNNTIL